MIGSNPELFNPGHLLLKTKGTKPRRGEIKNCDRCEKEFYKSKSQLRFKNYFCSRKCRLDFQKENAFTFPCYICFKPIKIAPAQLKYRRRSTCSPKCRRILAKQRMEQERKKRGVTVGMLNRLARRSVDAKEWREAVFQRDDFTCQMCGIRGTYLEADHIKPWAFFPDLRFELSNGRTLCRPCHDKTKMSARTMRKIYAI